MKNLNGLIQTFGGMLIVLTVGTLLFIIWSENVTSTHWKTLWTEAVLIFVVWVADGITKPKEMITYRRNKNDAK